MWCAKGAVLQNGTVAILSSSQILPSSWIPETPQQYSSRVMPSPMGRGLSSFSWKLITHITRKNNITHSIWGVLIGNDFQYMKRVLTLQFQDLLKLKFSVFICKVQYFTLIFIMGFLALWALALMMPIYLSHSKP